MGAADEPGAVVLSTSGSLMGGASIGIVQGRPLLVSNNATSAIWVMCRCDGSSLKMVQLVIMTQAGQAFVYANAAGYVASTCTSGALTQSAVAAFWNARTAVDVAACDSCAGYGVRNLVYSFPGKLLATH